MEKKNYLNLLAKLKKDLLDPKISVIRKSHLRTKIDLLKDLIFHK